MKTILMTICMIFMFHYCAYAEVSIKEYENGIFQVWDDNKVLSKIGSDIDGIEWLNDNHSKMSYTKFFSFNDAKTALMDSKKINDIVNETNLSNVITIYDEATIEIKEESKMSFIINVLGANLTIFLVSIFWIVGTFFTMKNVFPNIYEEIKDDGFDPNDADHVFAPILSLFFPIVYIVLLCYYAVIFSNKYVIKNIFKFLDKAIPKIEFKIEKEE